MLAQNQFITHLMKTLPLLFLAFLSNQVTITVTAERFIAYPYGKIAKCPTGAEIITQDECISAGMLVNGALRDGQGIVEGFWDHTPSGCFLADEDRSIHFNSNLNSIASGDLRYSAVCKQIFAALPTGAVSGCARFPSELNQEECLFAGMSVGGKLRDGELIVGQWDHTPRGCFLAEDKAIHYNTNPNSVMTGGDSRYNVVCRQAFALGYQDACPENYIVSKDDCAAAGSSVGGILRNGVVVEGLWTHTPSGCFLAEDHGIHFNSNNDGSSGNDPRYSTVCHQY